TPSSRRDGVGTPDAEEAVPVRDGLFGDAGGRYWDRTSDLFRVREARYRCANRPCRNTAVPQNCTAKKCDARWRRDSNPCGRLCRPLPRLSATPPGVRSLHLVSTADRATPNSSGCRDSNSRPSPCQGNALPLRHIRICATVRRRVFDCSRSGRQHKTETQLCDIRFSTCGNSPASVAGWSTRAIGAVGSALPSHGRGHQFESGIAHHESSPDDTKCRRRIVDDLPPQPTGSARTPGADSLGKRVVSMIEEPADSPTAAIETIKQSLGDRDFTRLAAAAGKLPRGQLLEVLERLGSRQRAIVYRLLPKQRALQVFEDLEPS